MTLLWPQGLYPARLLHPCDFPGKNIGMGCHFHLQRIFPNQDSNSRHMSLNTFSSFPLFAQIFPLYTKLTKHMVHWQTDPFVWWKKKNTGKLVLERTYTSLEPASFKQPSLCPVLTTGSKNSGRYLPIWYHPIHMQLVDHCQSFFSLLSTSTTANIYTKKGKNRVTAEKVFPSTYGKTFDKEHQQITI